MLRDRETDRLLHALVSPDWCTVEEAIDGLCSAIIQGDLAAERRLAEIEPSLFALADHPKWEVRAALARAIRYVKHDGIHAVVAKLLSDKSYYVKDAAKASLKRKLPSPRSDMLTDDLEKFWQDLLGPLTARFGQAAGDGARQAAEKYTELVIRQSHHELIRALTPADMALDKLLPILRGGKQRELASNAIDSLRVLKRILVSMRDLAVEVKPEFEPLPLVDLIAAALRLVEPRGKEITRSVELPDGVVLEADRVRLAQALSQFLQNSIEAHDGARGPVRLRIKGAVESARTVVLVFSDEGRGMSPANLRAAFHLFATSKEDGIGYGLPFARKVIESEHNGSVQLSSREGVGTTVTVVLPLEQERGRS